MLDVCGAHYDRLWIGNRRWVRGTAGNSATQCQEATLRTPSASARRRRYPYISSRRRHKTTKWSESGEDGVITGSVSGAFTFVHYESGGDPLFTLLTNAVHEFGIAFTLTPVS